MDPYIEACGLWEDFHSKLIGEIERSLAATVPERYSVRLGERSYVVLADSEGKESHPFLPDVSMTSPRPPDKATAGTAVAEPATDAEEVSLRAFIPTEYRETFVEIYEADPERLLVTCIEVLSPSNKRRGSEGWDLYLRKRQGLLLGAANLVEIDLLRGGQRLPMLDPWPNSPYTLLVCRRERAPYCRIRPAHFQRPLPSLSVPLTAPDPDVPLDLQPMIEAIYARSRYHRDIDYSRPLTPPLTAEETTWLAQQLQARQATP
jgi:hypothetical protein